jgi:hypothetical protein
MRGFDINLTHTIIRHEIGANRCFEQDQRTPGPPQLGRVHAFPPRAESKSSRTLSGSADGTVLTAVENGLGEAMSEPTWGAVVAISAEGVEGNGQGMRTRKIRRILVCDGMGVDFQRSLRRKIWNRQ